MLKQFKISTQANDVVSLTDSVREFVKSCNVNSGSCIVFTPYTTADLTVTSYWDPKGWEDLQDEIHRLVPTRIDFKHQHDTPQDAAGHVKSSLIGVSLSFIIDNGDLLLGHSQGIYFMEFDGPRNREYFVKVCADRE